MLSGQITAGYTTLSNGLLIDCCALNKVHVAGLSYDLAKAFHCVSHELLLPKPNFYGIRNIADQWLKSYLQGRKRVNL